MPLGYCTVTSAYLKDSTGTLVASTTGASATIRFEPVDNNGNSFNSKAGGANPGNSTGAAVQATVVAGVFSIQLADVSLATPINGGYAVSIQDNVSGLFIPLKGFGCFQPSYALAVLCGYTGSQSTWVTAGSPIDFDLVAPNLAGQISVQYGPQGATGAAGTNGVASLASLATLRAKQAWLVNLYNSAALTIGYYCAASNGALVAESGVATSDFIPANSGGSMGIAISVAIPIGATAICFYDQNEAFVSSDATPTAVTGGYTFPVPSTAAFVRICFDYDISGNIAAANAAMVVNGTTLPGSFQSFGTYATNVIDAKDAAVTATAASALATYAADVVTGAALLRLKGPMSTLQNLYNFAALTNGYYCAASNGALVALAGYVAVSDFIPANSGGSMALAVGEAIPLGPTAICFYDQNEVFVSSDVTPTAVTGGYTFPVPSTAAFVRITFNYGNSGDISTANAAMLVNGTVLPASYQAFGTYPSNVIDAKDAAVTAAATAALAAYGSLAASGNALVRVKSPLLANLFDLATATLNHYVAVGGAINALTGLVATDYIPANAGGQMVCNVQIPIGGAEISWYDQSLNYLGGYRTAAINANTPFSIPANAVFMRFSLNDLSDAQSAMLVNGTVLPATYQAFGTYPSNVIDAKIGNARPAPGSVIVFMGSSITAGQGLPGSYDAFPGLIAQSEWGELATIYNVGVGGQTTTGDLAQYTGAAANPNMGGVGGLCPHTASPAVTGNTAKCWFILDLSEVTNDWVNSISTATSISNLQSIVSQAMADGYFVVVMTSPILGGGYLTSPLGGVNAACAAQNRAVASAARTRVIPWNQFIDLSEVIPDQHNAVFYQDGTHPTTVGHYALYSVILGALASGGSYANFDEGYHHNPHTFEGGAVLCDTSGGLWLLQVSTSGALTTTAYTPDTDE